MNSRIKHIEAGFLVKWVLATGIGWPVGFIVAIVLSYTVVHLLYPKETNLILGLCLGGVIGFSQWYATRKHIKISAWWIAASAIGIGIPFIVGVVATELGVREPDLLKNVILDRTVIGITGGLLTGLLQVLIVKSISRKATWWIAISTLAWGVSWLVTAIGAPVGLIFGGVVLGVMGGIGILWMSEFPVEGETGRVEAAEINRAE
ncbi:MAG: serine/threonine protein kinase [Fidelibacterota bacterium]|nr:MAG: serine/threonine protein kinase [Candidatus Neomarinimicrobiota bacterium]